MKFHHSVFIGLILIFLSACGSKTPQLAPLAEDAVILAFGDSLTYGSGVSQMQSYPAVLEKLLGRKVINAGEPGEMSAEALPRLQELLTRHKPDLLLLCHGGNDILRKTDENTLIDNMRALINVARQKDVPVVLIGVPIPGPVMLNAAPLYYRVAKVFDLPYEARAIAKVLTNPKTKSDMVHPNAQGYQAIAEDVLELLRQAGALKVTRSE